MTTYTPTTPEELQETITWAAAEHAPLELRAGGSKRALGRPPETEHVLDLRHITGTIDYDPAELVLTARAATPLSELQPMLDAERQMLGFEPPDWTTLLPGEGAPTLGGTVACNMAGPRRVRAGAARDHLLGFAAVNGWGDAWKSGGRVVKNVTGYDMCKLQAGAMGTLSALTELTVRILPRPEMSCSLVLTGLDEAAATRTMAAAMNAPHEVSAAAHLPEPASTRAGTGLPGPLTLFRLEGHRPSVEHRTAALRDLLGGGEILPEAESTEAWRRIAAVQPLLSRSDSLVWRVCTTPSEVPAVLARIRAILPAEILIDWAGGLLWLSLDPTAAGPDCAATTIRSALHSGHATLIRAPGPDRARLHPFPPTSGPLAALTRRIKASFDPHAILNPGRMQEGI